MVMASVEREDELKRKLMEGVLKVFVESTGSIWKYCCILLQWEDTGKRNEEMPRMNTFDEWFASKMYEIEEDVSFGAHWTRLSRQKELMENEILLRECWIKAQQAINKEDAKNE